MRHHLRPTRPRSRWLIMIGAALIALMMSAAPASAHYVYDGGWTYRTDYDCTANRSEISHGRYGDGYSRSDVAAWEKSLIAQCTFPSYRPGGYIKTRVHLYKWNSVKKKWTHCYSSPWYSNTRNKHKIDLRVTYKGHGNGPGCGKGYYGTVAEGYVYNGGWHGGAIWSGYHYLPIS
ncbi:hypothetical protein [Streptomyces sp. MBT62]|uniref:hypothetical protein n=1 Tax=Streptomyces sp. MBT62 TaxID=2800410 RepID=UPI00190D74AC|nr:hypothetical protein [Streptomyces sp. MBT62]MBK3571609.1 hypothetical protein [Streptomyces sp. MBT62]